MDYFARISLEVQAFLSQVSAVVSDFLINNFQLVFCCSLTACEVFAIPSNVCQVVYSTSSTVDSHFTGVNSAVCTIDSYSICTVTSFYDTCSTVDVDCIIAGTQSYIVFQRYFVSFSLCIRIYCGVNIDVFATFNCSVGCIFNFIQLIQVNCIIAISTSFYVFDLCIVSIKTVSCNEFLTTNC